ncbi:unnamed protein product [Colletotrichum noveboracense]|uniref:Uncharacterized protein n=1 Tax=Colletotrichum noveboracense TaxID=2664923 RepID=A0A9W4RL74_9PEZI|nr:unnamed protein product [Colletotrichum noveboracense]
MPSIRAAITFLFALGIGINPTSAAHAGFHVQFPWLSRGQNPWTRPEIDQYNPFCRDIVHNPQRYAHRSRTFLSFSGHPGDLVTALYSRSRVPRDRDDFTHTILQDVPIQPWGQLCVNVTIPFQTKVGEMGVMYFEARDPQTGNVEYYCSDIKMADIEALPEEHPAMCAAGNQTLIPMPDEFL